MGAVSTVFGILIIVILIPALLGTLYIFVIKKNEEKMRDAGILKKLLFSVAVLVLFLGPTVALTYAGAHLLDKGQKSNGCAPGGVIRGRKC